MVGWEGGRGERANSSAGRQVTQWETRDRESMISRGHLLSIPTDY